MYKVKVEKLAFDVEIAGFDAKDKIKIIKEVRNIFGLGLKEVFIILKAKEAVERMPGIIKGGLKKAEAEEIKAKLEAIGC